MPQPDQVVKTFTLPNGDQLRATVQEFKGKTYVAVRVWYAAGNAFAPGKNGINLPVDQAEKLFECVDALKAALAVASA